MSVANTALLYNLGLTQFPVYDDLASLVVTVQTGATSLIGEACRVTTAIANGAFTLKSLLTLDGPPLVFVINDSAQTIKVFPFLSTASPESINGTANLALSIPTGQSGIFISVPNAKGATQDWRAAVIP
jgi:hypothetical protein